MKKREVCLGDKSISSERDEDCGGQHERLQHDHSQPIRLVCRTDHSDGVGLTKREPAQDDHVVGMPILVTVEGDEERKGKKQREVEECGGLYDKAAYARVQHEDSCTAER